MHDPKYLLRIGLLPLLALPLLAARCTNEEAEGDKDDPSLTKVTYSELTTAIPNPERGFYFPQEYLFKNGEMPKALSTQVIANNRAQNRTLLLLQYMLRDFIDKPISEEALTLIRNNMQTLRLGGAKCVLRFYYSNSNAPTAKPWDAEEAVALAHIAQLKPIMQEYGDVIYLLQAGFVGVWGEWYYTDHFGFNPKSTADFAPRRRIVEALLDAMPKNRQVAIRTPQAKMMCFGLTGADSITANIAHNESNLARTAGHNDCFLADEYDMGTFSSKTDRELWQADTRYSIMGGETCGTSTFSLCANSVANMEQYHWSYLNIAYHQSVITGWKNNDCFNDIERRLGHRLVLTSGAFTESVVAGQPFKASIKLKNVGFASPMNPRRAELVFISADHKTRFTQELKDDPRTWYGGGNYTITTAFNAPEFTPGTSYTLYLNLPDDAETLYNNPLYSIRTANLDTWDKENGYNKLYTFTAK